jgi:hypothetical protein
MHRFLRNNIFTNPKGWAQSAVGTPWRYRLMQSCTLVLGAGLACMLFVICREAQLAFFWYVSVLVFLAIATVQLPLFYLRALRSYVTEPIYESGFWPLLQRRRGDVPLCFVSQGGARASLTLGYCQVTPLGFNEVRLAKRRGEKMGRGRGREG